MKGRHANAMAFIEVFGNSFDPGAYSKFKSTNYRNVTVYTGGSTTRNPATPCRSDFCCDVENVLSSVIRDRRLMLKFFEHYISGMGGLSMKEQQNLEQKIGRELRRRGISPVYKYFKVIRK